MKQKSFEEAQTWHYERYEVAIRTRYWGWVAAGVITLVSGLQAHALSAMAPLKTVAPPVVLEKDCTTNALTEVRPIKALELSQDEALGEFNLTRYVIARETWDPAVGQTNHQLVFAYSEPSVWEVYAAWNQRGTPGSRVDLYGDDVVEVHIRSVSFLEVGQALVRFSTTRRARAETQHWISTVHFTYVEPPPEFNARQQNPMGFIVTHYRRDQEVIGAQEGS